MATIEELQERIAELTERIDRLEERALVLNDIILRLMEVQRLSALNKKEANPNRKED